MEGYPEGLAHLLIKRLDQKFMLKGGFKMSGLRDHLRNLKFKDRDNPNDFENVMGIKNLSKKLNEMDSISKDELVSHVISAAPKIIWPASRIIDSKGDAITVDDLEDEIFEWYELRNNKNEQEIAMLAFAGKCYNCRKDGHRANVVRTRRKATDRDKEMAGTTAKEGGSVTGSKESVASTTRSVMRNPTAGKTTRTRARGPRIGSRLWVEILLWQLRTMLSTCYAVSFSPRRNSRQVRSSRFRTPTLSLVAPGHLLTCQEMLLV